jgi:formylglycine-generating enzyme required for sulfatase activity
MKALPRLATIGLAAFTLCSLGVSPAHATPITASLNGYDLVKVGDPNNAAQFSANANQNGYGRVITDFWIGKFHFTNSQYTAFLNAIDPAGSNPNSVYNANMGSDVRGGISFTTGNASGAKYAVKTNMGDKPVNYVSWFDSARVSNWLHNGAQTYVSTDNTASAPQNNGAYTLGTATTGNSVVKNAGAQFYVPTENEWYKAAYYNPTLNINAAFRYRLYGNGFDVTPTAVTADSTGNGSAGTGSILGSGTGNFANFANGVVWNGQTGNVTTVGTNGAASYYGAFDMSGNVFDWNDLDGVAGSTRGLRGGGWPYGASLGSSAYRLTDVPSSGFNDIGFRLASPVPEPATLGMASGGALFAGGWWVLKRRRRARS